MSVLIEPGHVTEYPLNHARILYGNAITAATATGARAKFPASAALTETTYERWSPAESGDSITLTFPSQNINAIALAAHSELQPTIEVRHNGAFIDVTAYPTNDDPSLISDFTTDTHQLLNYSPDNQAILFLLKPRRVDAIRITVTYSGTAPTLGVVRAGNVLEMARPFYQGHNPAILAADNTLRPNVSESGEWLGASLIRQGRSVKMDWQNLASSWIREKWTPFSKTIKTSPFIIAWNAKKFSTDVFYCSSSDTPMPTHSGPRDLMSVSLSARGYSDGTEPEVLNLAASTFDEMFTFTRASAATIIDIDGTLREVGVDVPRLVEYDGAGGALGLLIEEARTNLITYSEQFDNAEWTQARLTVTANAVAAPDGTVTADKLVEDSGITNTKLLANGSISTLAASTVSVISCFAKLADGDRFLQVTVNDSSASARNLGVFDLSTGTSDSVAGVATSVEAFPDGWFKCIAVFTSSASTNNLQLRITDSFTTTDSTYSGDGTSGIYVWGAQVEEGPFPTSYIPTAGTQVTRAVDDCVRVVGDEYNQDEGTIYLEIPSGARNSSSTRLLFFKPISTSNFNEVFGFNIIPTGYSFAGQSAGNSAISSLIDAGSDSVIKLAASYKIGGDYVFAVNGQTTSGSWLTVAPLVEEIGIGNREHGHPNIAIKDFKVFPTALSEAELIALTGGN